MKSLQSYIVLLAAIVLIAGCSGKKKKDKKSEKNPVTDMNIQTPAEK